MTDTWRGVGVTGVEMQDRRTGTKDADFSEWMAARQPALLRTAYLITGDPHAAEDLVQTALAKVYLAWERIDGYVRKVMVNVHTSLWRRAWKRREVVSAQPPDRGRDDPTYDGVHDAQTRAILRLSHSGAVNRATDKSVGGDPYVFTTRP